MSPPDDTWKPNPGKVPAEAKGKRVRVWLESGHEGAYDERTDTPPGWAADGKGGCNWSLKGSPVAIAFYKVLG